MGKNTHASKHTRSASPNQTAGTREKKSISAYEEAAEEYSEAFEEEIYKDTPAVEITEAPTGMDSNPIPVEEIEEPVTEKVSETTEKRGRGIPREEVPKTSAEQPKEKKRVGRKLLLGVSLVLIGLVAGFLLGWKAFAPQTDSTEKEDADDALLCTVRYTLNGSEVGTEKVVPGETLSGIGFPEEDGHAVIGWVDVNGNEVTPEGMVAYTDMTFSGISGWAMKHEGGYFTAESGAFLPESPFTRLQAAKLLYSLMTAPPEAVGTVTDMDEGADGQEAVRSLVGAGLMDAPGGVFNAEGTLTCDDLITLLSGFFRPAEVKTAVESIQYCGGDAVTRAQAAVVLNQLLGIEDGTADMLDVSESYWAYGAIAAAQKDVLPSSDFAPGFHNVDGWLYYFTEDGDCLKNDYVNSLYFDSNGRYTSGSAELDGYVAAAIRENTTEDMSQHDKLRSMYNYVRDSFQYYRRSSYATGKTNFAVEDATVMYSTGMGNCYCYASAFWAAARGLGYDAQAVSGTIGKETSPHGWVEILIDGERYIYDTEIEMAYKRDNLGERDMFEMPYSNARASWMYVEYKDRNAVAPRENYQSFGRR